MARGGFVQVARVRVNIDDRAIGSFTRTAGGMVTRWNLAVTNEVKAEAAARTLAGTQKYGTTLLARSYSAVLVSTGESHCEVHLKNKQPYAKYVFLGTKPIIGNGMTQMPVGKSNFHAFGAMRISNRRGTGRRGFARAFTPKRFVKGQAGKNYPMVALRLVLMRRRILIR